MSQSAVGLHWETAQWPRCDQVTVVYVLMPPVEIPNKRVVQRSLDIMRRDGEHSSITIEEFDTSKPVVATMPEKVFSSIVERLIKSDAASSCRIGRAEAYLLPSDALGSFAVSVLERE